MELLCNLLFRTFIIFNDNNIMIVMIIMLMMAMIVNCNAFIVFVCDGDGTTTIRI